MRTFDAGAHYPLTELDGVALQRVALVLQDVEPGACRISGRFGAQIGHLSSEFLVVWLTSQGNMVKRSSLYLDLEGTVYFASQELVPPATLDPRSLGCSTG